MIDCQEHSVDRKGGLTLVSEETHLLFVVNEYATMTASKVPLFKLNKEEAIERIMGDYVYDKQVRRQGATSKVYLPMVKGARTSAHGHAN